MSVLRAVRDHFVAPAVPAAGPDDFVTTDEGPDRACAEPAPRTPSGVAVLAPVGDAPALGAALGLVLARERRSPAVVCVWTPAPAGSSWRAPATSAARRLASAMARRGLVAGASGRLVVVRLGALAVEAARDARRAVAVAGSAPTVLALGGPRSAEFDGLLAEQDLVVVATPGGTDPTLRRLAVAGLATSAVRACACDVLPAHLGRAAASAGVALVPSARRPIVAALEAMT